MGAGALQLAHVAAGRFDGFVELSLNAWDAMAGLLLVQEAGGYAAPFPGYSTIAQRNWGLSPNFPFSVGKSDN